ncbi:unnamed protein product [Larinioides sclopetarius]|uniref:Uncharacterized protein n=1 Tax=Larinioides sclopetarius TaxID=280406 RepID=A0AAV2AIE6_9ARAC
MKQSNATQKPPKEGHMHMKNHPSPTCTTSVSFFKPN